MDGDTVKPSLNYFPISGDFSEFLAAPKYFPNTANQNMTSWE